VKIMNLALVGSVLAFAACSSRPPAYDIPATANPNDEISKLESGLNELRTLNGDVLAKSDLDKAQDWLKEAREDSSSNEDAEEILDDVRKGQAYLLRARQTAEQRTPKAQAILTARQAALATGVREHAKLQRDLANIDEDFVDEMDDLDDMKPREVSDFQKRYLDLELAGVQEKQLGHARSLMRGLKSEDADIKAPKTYRQADVDLKSAENFVMAKRTDSQGYSADVTRANESAEFLAAVMAEMKKDRKLSEESAIALVQQKRQITELQSGLAKTQADREAARGQIALREGQLSAKERELAAANESVRMQAAIEAARQEFKGNEAEVFQQGNKLVVRLKSLQFSSGRSELPAAGIAILGKVKGVAEKLGPDAIVVEGHTDSVGSKAVNMELSSDRAKTVSDYFSANGLETARIESVGYGFDRPIASNKTKSGRAQNRRVDVVITPKPSAASGEAVDPAVQAR